jgi:hypothetical protein
MTHQRKTCTLKDESSTAIAPEVEIPNAPVTNNSFQEQLPYGIIHEINIIKKQTEKDNKEKSLTICELDNKIFIGNHAKGSHGSTEVLPCHRKYGKKARQIGDIHTHPFNDKSTIGLTPSEADFIGNLDQSFKSGIPQISCIVGAGKKSFLRKSDTVHCFQPKEELVNDAEKVKQYNRAYNKSENIGNDIHPFLREHIPNDFYHIWYKNGKAISKEEEKNPQVVKDLFVEMTGQSKKRLRLEDIKDMEKGSFCELIQGYNLPDNDNVGRICRDELERTNFLGYEY